MKVVHLDKENTGTTGHDYFVLAQEKETADEIEQAIAAYMQMIKKQHRKEFGYQRIMILYRKQKEYKKELAVLNEAIDDFEKLYAKRNTNKNKSIASISHKLMRSIGLADKKGNELYLPQPLPRWKKRKQGLKNLMSKKSK